MELLVFAVCLLCGAFARAEDAIDTSYQCHDLYLHDASVKGEVTSPFFHERSRYHDGLWCEWKITAPEGYRIKVTFKTLDVDCNGDVLALLGKDKETVLGYFCGTELPYPVFSNPGENEIRILFRTDMMVSGKGWRLEYESAPNMQVCDSGFIQCKNRNCYDSKKKCDGHDDCGDGTDEEGCNFPLVVEPKECGKPAITPNTIYGPSGSDRMVGGEEAIPNSWPWMVSLQIAGSVWRHFCGGTLINAQWVLTATHCVVQNPYPESMQIQLGAHYKYKKTKYQITRRAVKIIAYPDLELDRIRFFEMANDITLIKLNAPVEFSDGISPACLPHLGWKPQIGMQCYVSGWGVSRGSGSSDRLKQQEQIIESRQHCYFNEEKQICVGKPLNSPCHGDSGGPLQCFSGGKWYVFGAASFVTTTNMIHGMCVGKNAKTVYASASDKAEWIRTIINKYS